MDDDPDQFGHIDEFEFTVYIDFRLLVMGQLMAEGGYHGVIIGMAKRAEYVRNNQAGETGLIFIRPFLQEPASFVF